MQPGECLLHLILLALGSSTGQSCFIGEKTALSEQKYSAHMTELGSRVGIQGPVPTPEAGASG